MMDDLISRWAAIAQIKENYCHWCDHIDLCQSCETQDCIATIEQQVPAVDAVPVVHAKWDLTISMHYGERWQADASCSCCDFMKDNVWSGYFPDLPPSTARSITRHYAEKVKLPAYCERCGAKMDGET